jgi:hypothetical protein
MLHREELDVDADVKVVDLVEGENFRPEYLKIVSGICLLFNTSFSEAVFSEPQCYASFPHARRKIIHEHR